MLRVCPLVLQKHVLCVPFPEGPKIEKNQSRDARLKNSRFQSRNEIFAREWFFQSDPSLAAEKQGLGLKFSIENENVKPRMKISSENDFFVRVGMVFTSDRARMVFFDLWALWVFRRRDIPDKNSMQVAFFCCFRQGVARMSRDWGWDSRAKTEPQSQKIARTAPKNFLNTSRDPPLVTQGF